MDLIASPAGHDVDALVASLPWYHTIDLGNGVVTPGHYDHRPYLHYYGLPEDLSGKRAIDIGAASGFFSFELERRGAQVTATELPEWFDHDFGPAYQPDQTLETGQLYLHQPFDVAKRILGSNVARKYINIYDLSPETVGEFDIAFCGSVLLHLTDPIRALWKIAGVTREKAIIATLIAPEHADRSLAVMTGYTRGDTWWAPTRACLELMAVCAGFVGVEWAGEFRLDYRDGSIGPYHGVLHAYKTAEGWGPRVVHRDVLIERQHQAITRPHSSALAEELAAKEQEIERQKALIKGYESGRFMRLMRWLHTYRGRGRSRR
jgi:tRNA (mo5U34)-methyltransferase